MLTVNLDLPPSHSCVLLSLSLSAQTVCSRQHLVTLIRKHPNPQKEHCGGAVRCLSTAGLVIKTISSDKYNANDSALLGLRGPQHPVLHTMRSGIGIQ